jgi:hypothetical protein
MSTLLPPPGFIEAHVWEPEYKDGIKTGYSKLVRMKTLKEVFKELYAELDVLICDKCGHERKRRKTYAKPDYGGDKCKECEGEYESLLDEYFHGPDSEFATVPKNYRWVACYAVTGGNEGHYIHVEYLAEVKKIKIPDPNDQTGFGKAKEVYPCNGQSLLHVVRLAIGKTFRGMEHAQAIANRCARLLGA